MAKKKTAAKKPAAKKAPAAKSPKKSSPPAKKTAKSKTKKPAAEKTSRTPKVVGPKRIAKSSDDNQLHLLFKSDKQCRDCFEYLGIQTLEELVRLGPREIIERLSLPFMTAVERMRHRLADVKTCLAGDESFLQHHLARQS
jgi:hypothetical protein